MRVSRKGIKIILWAVVVPMIILLAAVYALMSVDHDFTIIPPSSVAAYTKDELADLYWTNKEAFTRVAEIVLANDRICDIITKNYDDDYGIFAKDDQSFFSEQDWSQVEELFEIVKPYMIMLSLRDNDRVVYFDFAPLKADGKDIDFALYYFKDRITMLWYKYYSWVGTLEQLDGYWYIGKHVWEYPLV